jgi:quercetin 2,3-dioxygenase
LARDAVVGAWCFIDHYGPMSVDGVTGMAVPPHPHIGLQTITWLMAGNVLHRDSLGSEQKSRAWTWPLAACCTCQQDPSSCR